MNPRQLPGRIQTNGIQDEEEMGKAKIAVKGSGKSRMMGRFVPKEFPPTMGMSRLEPIQSASGITFPGGSAARVGAGMRRVHV